VFPKCWEATMQMMIKKVLFILALCIQANLHSQKITDDFGTWWGVEVRKTFLKDFRASLQAEYRLNENSSSTKNFYIAPSLRYAPLKWLYLNLGYRFDNRYQKEDRYFTQRHRINFDIGFTYEIKRWEVEYRTRFQLIWEDYFSSKIDYPRAYNRNLLGVSFKWPQLPFTTSVSGELWLPLVVNTDLSKFRMIVCQEYKFKKHHRFQLRFVFQSDLNQTEIWRDYILSTRYIFSF
jgi:hypothetical protein